MRNSKEILMSAKRAIAQGVKKIFGDDIYLFIHLPALYLIAFLKPQIPNREGTKILELKLNRQIFNTRISLRGIILFLFSINISEGALRAFGQTLNFKH